MRKTSITQSLTGLAFLLLSAALSTASACGDLLEQVAEDVTTGARDYTDPCAAFDAQTCEAHSECWAWIGGAVGEAGQCGAEKFIACETLNTERGCNQAITFAQDPDGACWVFGNSCLPPGFQDMHPADPTCGWARLEQQACQAE